MKRIFIGLFLVLNVLFVISCDDTSSKTVSEMPEQMKKSIIILREGIMDAGETTVEELFLNKTFKSNELLDGSKKTTRYGKSYLSGNTYSLVLEIVNNDTVTQTMTYNLVYDGNKLTLLKSAELYDSNTKKKETFTQYADKAITLQFFKQLCN